MKKFILLIIVLLLTIGTMPAQQKSKNALKSQTSVNSSAAIQGTWYLTKSSHFTFRADGTTDFDGETHKYKYDPNEGKIFIYNSDGSVKHEVAVVSHTQSEMVFSKDGSTYFVSKERPAQPVAKISLSANSIKMLKSTTLKLSATILPADADNQKIIWTTSNKYVATVNGGLVKAIDCGVASITARSAENYAIIASCDVEVSGQVSKIELSEDNLQMKPNQSKTLTAKVLPADADNQKVIWTTSNKYVATVTNGVVKSLGYGVAIITARSADNSNISASCNVNVYGRVTKIELSETETKLKLNEYKTLQATVFPSDAENPRYRWSSSDENVAKVTSQGMVYGQGLGKADIIATALDGSDICAKCQVVVKDTVSPIKTYTVNGVSFNMINVEGGFFLMGATHNKGSEVEKDESPEHYVTLSNFAIGETEVTQALWYAVMGAKPAPKHDWSIKHGAGDNYPAYLISWNDCQEFIKKLNALTGETFRLPTEAEWEYAARGGVESKGYKYAGSDSLGIVAWYNANSGNCVNPVATKAPNELGLYDMIGNVWEWCSDRYGAYSSYSQNNPEGASTGSLRVCRGGGFSSNDSYCRLSNRFKYSPSDYCYDLGLRLAR